MHRMIPTLLAVAGIALVADTLLPLAAVLAQARALLLAALNGGLL